jgi:putative two-component system response regulator
MNILVAEDEAIALKRSKYFLEKWGHRVITVQNGLEALEEFLSSKIDLVITDWMMPEMDGLELVRHIRSRGTETPFVYVILLTAREDKKDIVNALESGVDDYIIKPFDPAELQARVNVGVRMVRLERSLKEYGTSLEKIVRRQTSTIRQTQEETIIRLLSALESRDKETGGHVRRMALFSVILAEAAGWPSQRVSDLRLAAPMHDIGKIGIPDTILRKTGQLSEEEFEIIKSHTIVSSQILKDSKYPMLQMAHDIALYHHEWWNGNGYPYGLAGEDIPEAARIVALVDVYDALSNDRFYRKASPEEEVLQTMKEGREKQFDPYFYDLFIDMVPRFKEIAKSIL